MPSPPAQASALGYTNNTFTCVNNWNANTIDIANTYGPGFLWYQSSFTTVTLNANGTANVGSSNVNGNGTGLVASVGSNVSPFFYGISFGGGGYFEYEAAFNDSQVNYVNGWPALWLYSTTYSSGNAQWPGQANGYLHFGEIDVMEYYTNIANDTFLSTIHDWYGTPNSSGQYLNIQNGQDINPPSNGYSNFNKYGVLWKVANSTSNGYVKWYVNDVQQNNTVQWTLYNGSANTPPPTGHTWLYGVVDTQQFVPLLTGCMNTAIVIRGFNVWQNSSANNAYNNSFSNGNPVANPDIANVTKNTILTATGNVLTNDVDNNGLTLSVATVNGSNTNVGANVTGSFGTLLLSNTGSFTYTLNNAQANVQSLVNGQIANDVFTYTITDGATYPSGTYLKNLLPYSSAFVGNWSTFGTAPTLTANVATPNPDGSSGNSVTQMVLAASADNGIYYTLPVTGIYTFSFWIKLVSGNGAFGMNYYSGSGDNWQTGTANTTWQRVAFTYTGNGNAGDNVAIGHGPSQTAAGTFQIFGAQVNPGNTATTYEATNGTAANVSVAAVIGSNLTIIVSGGTNQAYNLVLY